ncbi:hypothetical protein GCM10022226_26510 [Sphaerisporangium flaviroseum]|uniref:Uncharacterized protein n=1 Tax=Sphaerisporangium flaviroseum TaxID=509199 RepID=A0ABP7HV86_9ACTN
MAIPAREDPIGPAAVVSSVRYSSGDTPAGALDEGAPAVGAAPVEPPEDGSAGSPPELHAARAKVMASAAGNHRGALISSIIEESRGRVKAVNLPERRTNYLTIRISRRISGFQGGGEQRPYTRSLDGAEDEQ